MNRLVENTVTYKDPQLEELTEKLKDWLGNADNNFLKLCYWLIGYELPALGRDRQPYGWILEGLKLLDENLYYQRISEKVANFLADFSPQNYLTGKYDDKFLFNLFYLCAGLPSKGILAAPLREKYNYFKQNNQERERVFSDDNSYDVGDAFREALIANQIDETYYEVWDGILREDPSAFLFTYSIYDGYRGICKMPSLTDAELPNFNAVGAGLKQMANYLEDKQERVEKFRSLIERTEEVWSDCPQLEMEIYEQAIENSFPSWATDEILLPLIQINSKTNEITRYDVWAFIPNALTEIDKNFNVIPQNGFVLTIEVPNANQNTISFLNNILDIAETVRQQTPKESFPFQVKAITEEIFHFRDILHYRGNYEYSGIANDIFKNLRSFHQREEFKSKTEELYEFA